MTNLMILVGHKTNNQTKRNIQKKNANKGREGSSRKENELTGVG